MSDVWTIELEKEEPVITAELAQQSGESYTLPMAGPDILGGVKPAQKTNEMTKRVGIDENGRLWSEKESEQVIEEVIGKYLQNNPIISEETDPTVPEWAKQPNKPTYTAEEVGALPADTVIPVLPDTSETGQRAWVKHKEIVTTEETWGVTVDLNDGGVLPSFSEIKMHITFPDTSGGTSLIIQFNSNSDLILKATYTNAIAASKQTRFYGHASNDGSFVSGYVQNDWDFIPLKAKMYAPFDAGSVKSIAVNPTGVKLAVGVLIEIWGR